MVRLSTLSAAVLALSGYAAAHPGEAHDHKHMARQLSARDTLASVGRRSLDSCSNSAGAQALKARSVERRAKKVRDLREARGITTGE